MKRVMDYIDTAFSQIPDTRRAYKYKQKLIEEVTERANEITHAGIKDETVVEDLIISEHEDIKADFEQEEREYKAKKKEKQMALFRIIGSVVYFLAVVVIFLAIALITKKWAVPALVIILGGLSLYAAYVCVALIKKFTKMHFFFKQAARVLLYGSVFSFTVPLFLVLRLCFGLNKSWVLFIIAVIIGFAADSIYEEKIKDRFSIYFHLLYIVPAFALLYVVLSILGIISWHPGWIMVPASALIPGLIILYRLKKHNDFKNEEMEDDGEWKEEN